VPAPRMATLRIGIGEDDSFGEDDSCGEDELCGCDEAKVCGEDEGCEERVLAAIRRTPAGGMPGRCEAY